MQSPGNYFLARTEIHRLEAQLTLKFMGQQQEAETERLRNELNQLKLRMQASKPAKSPDDTVQFKIAGQN